MKVKVAALSTGWVHYAFAGGFAQVPPGFGAGVIPDEYIFQPSWNRKRINDWWRMEQSKMEAEREKD